MRSVQYSPNDWSNQELQHAQFALQVAPGGHIRPMTVAPTPNGAGGLTSGTQCANFIASAPIPAWPVTQDGSFNSFLSSGVFDAPLAVAPSVLETIVGFQIEDHASVILAYVSLDRPITVPAGLAVAHLLFKFFSEKAAGTDLPIDQSTVAFAGL